MHSIDNYIDLKGIDFKVKTGEFVCVIGAVGSGKSSLLSAISGDMMFIDEKYLSDTDHPSDYY